MISHENVVDAVNQSTDAWSCPNWEEECDNCGKCGEWLVTEYENSLRNEAREKTIKEMAQIITKLDYDMSCVHKCKHEDDGVSCTECVLKRAIMQMKEGGENDI